MISGSLSRTHERLSRVMPGLLFLWLAMLTVIAAVVFYQEGIVGKNPLVFLLLPISTIVWLTPFVLYLRDWSRTICEFRREGDVLRVRTLGSRLEQTFSLDVIVRIVRRRGRSVAWDFDELIVLRRGGALVVRPRHLRQSADLVAQLRSDLARRAAGA